MACAAPTSNPSPNGGENKGENSPQGSFKSESVTGLFNGKPWSILSGTATPNRFDPSEVQITLSDTFYELPCQNFSIGKRLLITRVPLEGPSLTQFGQGNPMKTATFSFEDGTDGWMNLIAVEGKIQITSITETTVTGSIKAQFDTNHSINGTFVIPLCARP